MSPPHDPGAASASHVDAAAVPDDRWYAPEYDLWVQPQPDGTAVVGITALAAAQGQFLFFSPRPLETTVARGRSLGVMELVKTAVAVHAPVSCRIVAINPAVVDDITRIQSEPYGRGWLLRVVATAWDDELVFLMNAAAYRPWLQERLRAGLAPSNDAVTLDIDPLRGFG